MIFEAQLADLTRAREQQLLHDCVEQAVLAEHPGLFPSEAETVRFIRAEIARSTR